MPLLPLDVKYDVKKKIKRGGGVVWILNNSIILRELKNSYSLKG